MATIAIIALILVIIGAKLVAGSAVQLQFSRGNLWRTKRRIEGDLRTCRNRRLYTIYLLTLIPGALAQSRPG